MASVAKRHRASIDDGYPAIAMGPVTSYAFPVQTSVAACQRWFTRGLGWTAAFHREEVRCVVLWCVCVWVACGVGVGG
jgi:hypothetical protein